METVLIIEDSRPMQRAIERLFSAESFEVLLASDGIAGLETFRSQRPNAVVLDLKLPGIPGRELCREFKTLAPAVPVVVVSANSEVDDKVLLLELGADDYVTKPFSPKELLARVRRAMRRVQQALPAAGELTEYRFGDIVIHCESMEIFREGRQVPFTVQEFRLLKYLVQRPGHVLTREELLNEVWGYQAYPSTRTVDNHILHLRQKLEPDPANPRYLLTVHGAGYKFVPAASSQSKV